LNLSDLATIIIVRATGPAPVLVHCQAHPAEVSFTVFAFQMLASLVMFNDDVAMWAGSILRGRVLFYFKAVFWIL
jgi:hypothetical protein